MALKYTYNDIYDKDKLTYDRLTDKLVTGYLIDELSNGDRIEMSIRDGQKQGITKIYDRTGWLKLEAHFHEDEKQGSVKEYDVYGEIVTMTHYRHNLKDGETKHYKYGKLWLINKYKEGELISSRDVIAGQLLLDNGVSEEIKETSNIASTSSSSSNAIRAVKRREHAEV